MSRRFMCTIYFGFMILYCAKPGYSRRLKESDTSDILKNSRENQQRGEQVKFTYISIEKKPKGRSPKNNQKNPQMNMPLKTEFIVTENENADIESWEDSMEDFEPKNVVSINKRAYTSADTTQSPAPKLGHRQRVSNRHATSSKRFQNNNGPCHCCIDEPPSSWRWLFTETEIGRSKDQEGNINSLKKTLHGKGHNRASPIRSKLLSHEPRNDSSYEVIFAENDYAENEYTFQELPEYTTTAYSDETFWKHSFSSFRDGSRTPSTTTIRSTGTLKIRSKGVKAARDRPQNPDLIDNFSTTVKLSNSRNVDPSFEVKKSHNKNYRLRSSLGKPPARRPLNSEEVVSGIPILFPEKNPKLGSDEEQGSTDLNESSESSTAISTTTKKTKTQKVKTTKLVTSASVKTKTPKRNSVTESPQEETELDIETTSRAKETSKPKSSTTKKGKESKPKTTTKTSASSFNQNSKSVIDLQKQLELGENFDLNLDGPTSSSTKPPNTATTKKKASNSTSSDKNKAKEKPTVASTTEKPSILGALSPFGIDKIIETIMKTAKQYIKLPAGSEDVMNMRQETRDVEAKENYDSIANVKLAPNSYNAKSWPFLGENKILFEPST